MQAWSAAGKLESCANSNVPPGIGWESLAVASVFETSALRWAPVMFTNPRPVAKLNVVDILLKQNLYERLGLKTNRASFGSIHWAYNARLNLLYGCRQRLSDEEIAQAESIINDAYSVLSDSAQRDKYDLQLSGKPDSRCEHSWLKN